MMLRCALLLGVFGSSLSAQEVTEFTPDLYADADVVIIGEIHDDPSHHLAQAAIIADLRPAAVVFEMLTAEQASRITPANISDPHLGETLGWAAAGWPDFAMYAPVFAAAGSAQIYGAAPSESAQLQAQQGDVVRAFRAGAAKYGLSNPLEPDEQAIREQAMQDSHCGGLPIEMLGWFVDQQRFRDAVFARSVVAAFEQTGGPVVLITGNGHARTDWGVPVYLGNAAPSLQVVSLGQVTQPYAPFDAWTITPAIPREDPCAAFR